MNTDTITEVPTGDVGPFEPTDLETAAERALLGAMLTPLHVTRDGHTHALSSPAIIEARRVLGPDEFYAPRHQLIAAAVFELADSGARGIDPLMVANHLADRLPAAGGLLYINSLMAASVTTTNAGWQADRVRAAANRRHTWAYAQRITQAASTPALEAGSLLERVTVLHDRYLSQVRDAGVEDLPSVAGRQQLLTDLVHEWGQPDRDNGALATGLYDLDSKLNVGPGALVVLAGRPGSGKSMLADQIVWHCVSELAWPVIAFSVEMTVSELVERAIARIAGVRLDSATGKTEPTAQDLMRVAHAADTYAQAGAALYYDDTPDLTLPHIEARYEEVKQAVGPPRLVSIDYLQLMSLPAAERRDLAIQEATRRLKVFAQRTQSIVLLCCQLNRGPETRQGGVPQLADLRESGSIEQDANAVLLLHDAGRYSQERLGEVDVIIAKQRRGGSGITVPVADSRAYGGFRNLARAPAPRRDVPDLDQMQHDPGWWGR